jgi:hypothetical protein
MPDAMADSEALLFDKAMRNLWDKRTIRYEEKELVIACLVRAEDWRPLSAPWWRSKEASIIGTDLDSNFFLRHCDGTVRLWHHGAQMDYVLFPSVRAFVRSLTQAPGVGA